MNIDFTPPQEWERKINNLATGQLNHRLRSVLSVMTYYWEMAILEGWNEDYENKYNDGQIRINNLLAAQIR